MDMNLKPVQRAQLRRDAIVEIVRLLEGRLPSVRKMAELLGQRGIQTSHVQVSNDYHRLKLGPHESCLPLFAVKDLTLVGEKGARGEFSGQLQPAGRRSSIVSTGPVSH
jgi:hypothetical protein